MKYNHYGIPTTQRFEGEIRLDHLKMTVSNHLAHPFRHQFMRFDPDAPYPELVKNVPHMAFEVDDLEAALKDQNIIIAPNFPAEGLQVAFIEVKGQPIELMQIDRTIYQGDI